MNTSTTRREGLFNDPVTPHIDAYDIHGKICQRKSKNFKFRLSVYGLLIEEGYLLFQQNPNIEALCIPGGAVEIDENMEDALKREFLEETGIHVQVGDQISTIEDFFTTGDEDSHSVLVFYLVTRDQSLPCQKEFFHEDSCGTKFVNIKDLDSIDVQRVFQKFLDGNKSRFLPHNTFAI